MWDYKESRLLSKKETEAKIASLYSEGLDYRALRMEFSLDQLKFAEENPENISSLVGIILESGVEVAPFESRVDVTVRFQEFFEDMESGVFLRIYVPHERWQSDQLSRLLGLLERYLTQVEARSFSIDTRKTAGGTVYIFLGEKELASVNGIEGALLRLDSFLVRCRSEPSDARKVVEAAGLQKEEADFVVSKYAREYHRLTMDSRHELEYKKLLLSQRLEAEVFEAVAAQVGPQEDTTSTSIALSLTGNSGPINISVLGDASQEIEEAKSTIGTVVGGDSKYSPEDELLLSMFRQYGSQIEAVGLRSDLDQLKDGSSKETTKKTAKQRLFSFLYKAGSRAAEKGVDLGVKALVSYLETLGDS